MSTIRRRGGHLLVKFVVVSTLAAGAAALAAAPASAEPITPIPEKTIKAECKAARGKYTTSTTKSGNTSSSCYYTDIDGYGYIDTYKNGKYTGTM